MATADPKKKKKKRKKKESLEHKRNRILVALAQGEQGTVDALPFSLREKVARSAG